MLDKLALIPNPALCPTRHHSLGTHKNSLASISVLVHYQDTDDVPKEETRDGDLAVRRRCDAGQRVHGVLEDQQRLLDLLVEATATVIIGLPGFVSAKPHKSLDGARVATYSPGGEAERTS